MNHLQPIIRLPGEGDTVMVKGNSMTYKAHSAETGGMWSFVHYIAPSRFTPAPPHIHDFLTEIYYVLDGTLSVQLGNKHVEASGGTFISIPPDLVHTVSNNSPDPAEFLLFLSPGGFEHLFNEMAQLSDETSGQASSSSKRSTTQAKYDIRFPDDT